MKKILLAAIIAIPALLFGQTTPTWQQTLKANSTATITANASLNTAGTLSLTAAGVSNYGTTGNSDVVVKRNSVEMLRVNSVGTALGLGSTTDGILQFKNATNNFYFQLSPTGLQGSTFGWVFPAAQGGPNTLLSNNGSGALDWVAAPAGSQWITAALPVSPVAITYTVGNVGVGTMTTTSTLTLKGAGTTTATTVFNAINNSSVNLLTLYNSGQLNIGDANENIFAGNQSGLNVTSGTLNTMFGEESGAFLSTGARNTSYGAYSMRLGIVTGTDNVAIGYKAMEDAAGAANNVAVGAYALSNATTSAGSNNVAVGFEALLTNTTAEANTAVGYQALRVATTSGSGNTAVGWNAGLANTQGFDNVFLGYLAGGGNTTGDNNVCVGEAAGNDNTTGGNNTKVGHQSGRSNNTDGGVYLGFRAGYYETEANKFFVDNAIRASEADGRIKALIYGVFDATAANQSVTINGQLCGTQLHNNANAPTGTTKQFIASGTYTATITDSTNVAGGITAYQAQWIRVGNVVTVSGVVDVDPSGIATNTGIIKISLPIPSNFTIKGNCRGTATAEGIAGQSASILESTAYAVADFALMKWIITDVTNQPMSYEFTYVVQ